MTFDAKILSDVELSVWEDALTVDFILDQCPAAAGHAQYLRSLTPEDFHEVDRAVHDEFDRRAMEASNTAIDEELNKSMAKLDSGEDMSDMELIRNRTARLLKVLRTDLMPEAVLRHMASGLMKSLRNRWPDLFADPAE